MLAGVLVGVGIAGAGVAFAYLTFTDAANGAAARAVAATLSRAIGAVGDRQRRRAR